MSEVTVFKVTKNLIMKRPFVFILLMFLFVNVYSQSKQNGFLLGQVLRQLKLKPSNIHEVFYREKKLPNKPSQTLLIIPKYRTNETDDEGHLFLELDAYIILADNTTGKILYKFVEENAWTSDAMVLSEITINTGVYQLNEKDRAFGIRVDYRGSSNPNPYSYTDLSLFVIQDNAIKKILNNYQIERSTGEWDTRCAGEYQDIFGTIDMGKNRTNGFKNLMVKNKIMQTKSFETNDGCDEKVITKNTTKYLKFNGKEYK